MVCDICGNDQRFETLLNPGFSGEYAGSKFIRCNDCEFVFLYPMLSDRQLQEFYHETDYYVYEINEDWKRREADFRAHSLMRDTGSSKGSKLLEIGSSYGYFLDSMAKRGFQCEGVEFNRRAVEKVRQKGYVIYEDPIEDICDAIPSSFDVIAFWHTLEHVPDPRTFLRRVNRLLKMRGICAVAVPNMDSLHFLSKGTRWSWFGMPHVCIILRI